MANFGAFPSLPLRLTDDTWSAAQHARFCADLAAAQRTCPLAFISVSSQAGGGGSRVTLYEFGRDPGNNVPVVSDLVTYGCAITWEKTYVDASGVVRPWNITRVECSANSSGNHIAMGSVTNPTQVRVYTTNAQTGAEVDVPFTAVVYGYTDPAVEEYGGDLDKENCETERTPYAVQFYHQLQEARGSAYSKELSGLVHVENLALARHYAGAQRLTEKLGCEMNPGTADTRLGAWSDILNVSHRLNDSKSAMRARCVSKYQAIQGNQPPTVDSAISALLGDWYVQSWLNWGDTLSSPPALTYWPTANPGPPQWDLGGGCWMSERANWVVEVKQPTDAELGDFLALMNGDLFQLLDQMLPAHWTFSWCTNADDGFILDSDRLDEAGMV